MTAPPEKREKTERVLIHFTGTVETDFETIRAEHKQRGLSDIGFHYVIDPEGKLLMGRHQSLKGEHYEEFDAVSVGIVVIGDRYEMNEEQEVALNLLMDKMRADYPEAEKINYIYRKPLG